MIIDKNYNFTLTVSVDGYSGKKESIDCLRNETASQYGKKQMAFYETTMTTDTFMNFALSGHSFSGLYTCEMGKTYKDNYGHDIKAFYTQKNDYRKGALKMQFKKNEYFKSSQIVYVDVDETRFTSINDYVSVLSQKPSCVYTTFSDNIEKHAGKGDISRRFRLVYILDTQLQAETWTAVATAVSEMVKRDTGEDVDCCGNRITQHMNGSNGSETYISYTIYSPFDFDFIQYLPQYQTPKTIEENLQDNTSISEEYKLDDRLVKDMEDMDYDAFMKKYSRVYKYIYRTEKPDWEYYGLVDYQETDNDYLQLWFYPEKLVDGEGRRQTIANRAFQLRLISPEADINTILFNLYVFRNKFIDNSDGTITIKVLVNRAKQVFIKNDIEKNIEEQKKWIEYCHKNRPRFITRTSAYDKVPQSIINEITQRLNYRDISLYYDKTKTQKENLDILKSNGIEVSQSTLSRFINERQEFKKTTKKQEKELKKVSKDREIALFKKLYNPNLSARKNAEELEKNGLKISKNKVIKWAKEYIQVEENKTEIAKDNINTAISFPELPKFNFNFNF